MTLSPLTYALLAAITVLVGATGVQSYRVHSAHVALAAEQNKVTQRDLRIALADAASDANRKTIEALQAANASNESARLAAQWSAAAADAQAQAMRDQRDTAEAKSKVLTETIYAKDPACAAWGDLPVCPGVAQRLRERTRL